VTKHHDLGDTGHPRAEECRAPARPRYRGQRHDCARQNRPTIMGCLSH
jgi:hypothetical protein